MTDTHLWKHYLPTTSFADGNRIAFEKSWILKSSHLWCTKKLCVAQISREVALQEFDVDMKYANDKLTLIKTQISTLNGFVAVVSDEHREMASQEEDTKRLLDQYFGHLKQVGFLSLIRKAHVPENTWDQEPERDLAPDRHMWKHDWPWRELQERHVFTGVCLFMSFSKGISGARYLSGSWSQVLSGGRV